MSNQLKEKSIQSALDVVLHQARQVAYVDDAEGVGMEDFFRKLQAVSIELSGLKAAVKRYDETLAYFEEEEVTS